MKIFHGYKNIENLKDPVAAIGIFDGLHIGHKKVITRVLNTRDDTCHKVIITFDPHPRSVLYPRKKLPRIMSLDHRLLLFEKMGIDAVIIIKFTDFIAEMGPEEFIRRVVSSMGIKAAYVGSNFHFGRKKSGNIDLFKKIGRKYGVVVHSVDPVKKQGKIVSSTWLRALIRSGRLSDAEKLLRRPVSILGTVVSGEARGRGWGIPTANIDPHHEVIPPPGVYAVKIDHAGRLYNGVLNVGFKPTFYGRKLRRRKEPCIEVNLFDYSGDLYGKALEIFFIKKIRKEKKFKKEAVLVDQIRKDKEKAALFLKKPEISRKIKKYKYL